MVTSPSLVIPRAIWLNAIVFSAVIACSPEDDNRSGRVDPSNTGMDASAPSGSGGSNVDTNDSGSGGAGGSTTTTGGTDAASNPEASVREPEVCAEQTVQLTHKTPLVMFVVDRSGSTAEAYGNTNPDAGPVISRWDALHEAIMDPTSGVVAKTQSEIYIGIVLYDGGPLEEMFSAQMACLMDPTAPGCPDGPPLENPTCPRLIKVSPAQNNYNAIAEQYTFEKAGPDGLTPTALALEAAYKEIESYIAGNLDTSVYFSPVVILVTDGEPNGCTATFDPNTMTMASDYQGPIDQVTAASQKDIKTFVIGIDTSTAGSPPEVGPHLDDLAKIGSGAEKAFVPTNKDELSEILIGLIEQSNCDIALQGEIVEGYEDKGTVTLNGTPLIYNDPNGYAVPNPNQITLVGTACEKFARDKDVVLVASFPCEAIVLM
ncbi:MAG: VWA domain-containing protein [Deltaproteobacteria bacterium]|nr:VWA domain-containing protein [Deltaproteobacteria bacterium]